MGNFWGLNRMINATHGLIKSFPPTVNEYEQEVYNLRGNIVDLNYVKAAQNLIHTLGLTNNLITWISPNFGINANYFEQYHLYSLSLHHHFSVGTTTADTIPAPGIMNGKNGVYINTRNVFTSATIPINGTQPRHEFIIFRQLDTTNRNLTGFGWTYPPDYRIYDTTINGNGSIGFHGWAIGFSFGSLGELNKPALFNRSFSGGPDGFLQGGINNLQEYAGKTDPQINTVGANGRYGGGHYPDLPNFNGYLADYIIFNIKLTEIQKISMCNFLNNYYKLYK